MLVYLYVFALVFGGILLLASIFTGGNDADADAGGDIEASDVDAGGDVDADTHGDAAHHGHGSSIDVHGALGLFTVFLSLRFWTFFLAFFGATGLAFHTLELVHSSTVTLIIAAAMGVLTGYATVLIMRALSTNQSGAIATAADYVGQSGRVLLPIAPDQVGKVRLQIGGTTVDVLATSEEQRSFAAGDEALVIHMQGTTAVVARIDDKVSS
jgi:membrane protein implicated in regulation of membrane protease activity